MYDGRWYVSERTGEDRDADKGQLILRYQLTIGQILLYASNTNSWFRESMRDFNSNEVCNESSAVYSLNKEKYLWFLMDHQWDSSER